MDSCTVTGSPPIAATETGLWRLADTNRSSSELSTYPAVPFSHMLERMKAHRAEGGGRGDAQRGVINGHLDYFTTVHEVLWVLLRSKQKQSKKVNIRTFLLLLINVNIC